MKNIITCMLLLTGVFAFGQSPSKNYVKTKTFKNPSTGAITANDTLVNITYYEGLGKPLQTIAVKSGGNNQDIVTPITYDICGRQSKQYLPYANPSQTTASLSYRDPATLLSSLNTAYVQKYPADLNATTPNPYSETFYEASPLNRVVEQDAPGQTWKAITNSDTDHTIKYSYATNITNEVRRFSVIFFFFGNVDTQITELYPLGYYPAAELYKTITKDENWTAADGLNKTTEEFKDKLGRIVLKRTYNQGQAHNTYYVYDDFGNLTYVIPPLAADTIIDPDVGEVLTSVVDGLCYIYHYDKRNRLIEKHIPDNGWTHIVYDKLDRPVMTQDENLRAKSSYNWLFTKYDKFGRIVYTGQFTDTRARKTLQTYIDGLTTPISESRSTSVFSNAGATVYYTNTVYPQTGIDLFTINYYDDYNFDLAGITIPSSNYYATALTPNKKSLATGTKTRVLTTTSWITTLTGYDAKARPIWSWTKNPFLGTDDVVESSLDFTGNPIQTKTQHIKGTNLTIFDNYTYDMAGRVLKQWQTISGVTGSKLIAYNKYDELGQLVAKKVGGTYNASADYTATTALQTIDYSYNVRGWLKGINDVNQSLGADLFAFKINYNTKDKTQSGLFYNGNISETHWKSLSDGRLRSYSYAYDALNRLSLATYIGNHQLIDYNDEYENYTEGPVTYNKNGNILTLERYGLTSNNVIDKIDVLAYNYMPNSNKLRSVIDTIDPLGFNNGTTGSADDYKYDLNGNMVKDFNKTIGTATADGITYNHLNLPSKITVSPTKSIDYTYTADGVKLQKKVTDGSVITTTLYDGGFQYLNGTLDFFVQPEGYVKKESNGSFSYIYQYKDHLGNVRLSYKDADNNGAIAVTEILEQNNYYPFGLQHRGYNNTVIATNKYKYNGKELQDELGLGIYDFGARNYEPALGRWFNVDPLAETSRRFSPYVYALNNPVYFIDPDGMSADDFADDWKKDANGNYVYDPNLTWENRSTQLGQGEEYVGRAGTLLTGTDTNGDKNIDVVSMKYNLNADGSVTDVNGNNVAPGQVINLDTGSTITAAGTSQVSLAASPLLLTLATGALDGMAADAVVPDPTDAAPQKWVVYGVAAIVSAAIIYSYSDEINNTINSTITPTTTIGHYDSMSRDVGESGGAEHTAGARPSTKGVHEKGQARKARDRGGEKADINRRVPNKRPPNWKGPWPPKK